LSLSEWKHISSQELSSGWSYGWFQDVKPNFESLPIGRVLFNPIIEHRMITGNALFTQTIAKTDVIQFEFVHLHEPSHVIIIYLSYIQWGYSLHVKNNPAPGPLNFLNSPPVFVISSTVLGTREFKN